MQRYKLTPRENWQAKVESQGFHFHSVDGHAYWDESAAYVFETEEIDRIEKATLALNELCLKAVEYVISHNLLDAFQIPPAFRDWLAKSWEEDEHTIYGRFDLAYEPGGVPKMLEYNADTPTALLEAAVIQWFWLKDVQPHKDQFNSLHERLIEAWRRVGRRTGGLVHFASVQDHLEDYMTANYLRDTALQAGLTTEYLAVEEIAWNAQRQQFVDPQERAIETIFKLYPWEWMLHEEFGPHLIESNTRWLEPAWKMLLSNKAILPVLWHLNPDHPNLLRSEYEPFGFNFVKKPMQGREGANVAIHRQGRLFYESPGDYDGPAIYQEYCHLPHFDGNYAVFGSWMVNGYACGLGIREDIHPVTQNTSRFVPHWFE